MIVARPGAKKSPAIKAALAPLYRLIKEEDKKFSEFEKKSRAKKICIETEIDKIKKGKTHKKGDDAVGSQSVESHLSSLLEELDQINVKKKRYLTSDTTIEKLLSLLSDNKNGLLIYRDELYGLLKNFDKSGHEGDKDFYLEAWNGDGSFTCDRISRGTTHADGICLSILGGIQPKRLLEYAKKSIGTGDDGFIQRFQLMVFPEDSKDPFLNIDEKPKTEEANKVFEIFKKIEEIESGNITLRFSDDAQNLFNEWLSLLEKEIREQESPDLESHLSKYRSLMPSLALIFYVIYCISNDIELGEISSEATKLAIHWCSALKSHAQKVYAPVLSKELICAYELLKRISKGEIKDGDSVREIYRKGWSHLSNINDVIEGLKCLAEHSFIKLEERKSGSNKGAPSVIVKLNPALKNISLDEYM